MTILSFDLLTLTFNLREQMFQMAFLLLEDNNCAKLFCNPCINVQVMAQTSSIYDPFNLYLTHVTLMFNLSEKIKNVSNGTSPSQRATTVQNYFEIHAQMYQLWPGQAQYMTILTFI